jgi:hypothetical protein
MGKDLKYILKKLELKGWGDTSKLSPLILELISDTIELSKESLKEETYVIKHCCDSRDSDYEPMKKFTD